MGIFYNTRFFFEGVPSTTVMSALKTVTTGIPEVSTGWVIESDDPTQLGRILGRTPRIRVTIGREKDVKGLTLLRVSVNAMLNNPAVQSILRE